MMTSIFWQMGEDLNSLVNERRHQFFWQMEDDLNHLLMDDDFKFLILGLRTRDPSLRPPSPLAEIFWYMSADSPSNISPNPLEVISEVSET